MNDQPDYIVAMYDIWPFCSQLLNLGAEQKQFITWAGIEERLHETGKLSVLVKTNQKHYQVLITCLPDVDSSHESTESQRWDLNP